MKPRFLLLFCIALETCAPITSISLSNIGRDILDLYIKEEIPDEKNNSRIGLYLSATKRQDNGRELSIIYGHTSLFLKPSFKYKGYDIVVDGNSDGFYWDGDNGTRKHLEKWFKYDETAPLWSIIQYDDNTINRFLSSKGRCGFQDITDLIRVFDSYGLLKDDSSWAKQYCFSSIEVDYPAKFDDWAMVNSFIKKEFKPIEAYPYCWFVFAHFMVSKNGNISFVDLEIDDIVVGKERDLLKSECTRVANMICKNFKMIPAIHRGITVDSMYTIPFNYNVMFVQPNQGNQ